MQLIDWSKTLRVKFLRTVLKRGKSKIASIFYQVFCLINCLNMHHAKEKNFFRKMNLFVENIKKVSLIQK